MTFIGIYLFIDRDVKNVKNEDKKELYKVLDIKLDKKKKYSKNKNNNDDNMEWASGLIQQNEAIQTGFDVLMKKFENIQTYKNNPELNYQKQNEYRMDDPLNEMDVCIHTIFI